jgi:hypothetical protein
MCSDSRDAWAVRSAASGKTPELPVRLSRSTIALLWPRVYGHDRVRWSPARAKWAGEVSVAEPPWAYGRRVTTNLGLRRIRRHGGDHGFAATVEILVYVRGPSSFSIRACSPVSIATTGKRSA